MTYIDIPNWQSLKHYRTRRLTWVKLHTSLLHDDSYLRLTGHQRAVLHGLPRQRDQAENGVAKRFAGVARERFA